MSALESVCDREAEKQRRSVKTVAGSAGTAVTGAALAMGPYPVLAASAALIGFAALVAVADRRLSGRSVVPTPRPRSCSLR